MVEEEAASASEIVQQTLTDPVTQTLEEEPNQASIEATIESSVQGGAADSTCNNNAAESAVTEANDEEREKSSLKKKTQPSTTNPPLPDDILVSCLARISKFYYPALSLVSKRFQSLIASPVLYQTRSSLDRTESCLYVCFWTKHCSRWFTLCRKPEKTLNSDTKSIGYVLAALPAHNSFNSRQSKYVALGANIYKIGDNSCTASSSVSVFNCVSNTWHEAPSMQVKRFNRGASVLDGKIYVGGGCEERNPATWMEVFDPKTQTWEFVSGPKEEILDFTSVYQSAVIDGTVYNCTQRNGLAYNPKEGKWERVPKEMTMQWLPFRYCVIDNVLYHCPCKWGEEIQWYDTKARSWRNVNMRGEGLPPVAGYSIRMADYGGKMVVLWETSYVKEKLITYTYPRYVMEKLITCAVIKLQRCGNEEIKGKIQWCDQVLTVPESFDLVHALTATL